MRQLAGTKTRYRRAHAAPLTGLISDRVEYNIYCKSFHLRMSAAESPLFSPVQARGIAHMSRITIEFARFASCVVVAALLSGVWTASADAGMPALLPSSWTAESSPDRASSGDAVSAGAVALRIQTMSFFVAVFLLSGWLVKGLGNLARRDFPMLPVFSYGRSLALVTLWGERAGSGTRDQSVARRFRWPARLERSDVSDVRWFSEIPPRRHRPQYHESSRHASGR